MENPVYLSTFQHLKEENMGYKIKNERGGDTIVLTHKEKKEETERSKNSGKKVLSNGERRKYKASGGIASGMRRFNRGGKV